MYLPISLVSTINTPGLTLTWKRVQDRLLPSVFSCVKGNIEQGNVNRPTCLISSWEYLAWEKTSRNFWDLATWLKKEKSINIINSTLKCNLKAYLSCVWRRMSWKLSILRSCLLRLLIFIASSSAITDCLRWPFAEMRVIHSSYLI